MLNIIKPGTNVIVADGIDGVIVQANVMLGDAVMYQVAWWDGRSRRLEWLHDCELPAQKDAPKRMRLGFGGES